MHVSRNINSKQWIPNKSLDFREFEREMATLACARMHTADITCHTNIGQNIWTSPKIISAKLKNFQRLFSTHFLSGNSDLVKQFKIYNNKLNKAI
jgi:hypothetical protein